MSPIVFTSLFDSLIPRTLIDCISECLRYNPRHRITPRNLLNHTYFRETVPKLQAAPYIPAMPEAPSRPSIPAQALTAPYLPSSASSPLTSPPPPPDSTASSVQNVPNRDLPPSHSVPGPKPGFNLVDPAANRTLPPLQSAHQGSGNRVPFFPQYRDVSSPVMPPTPSSASSHSLAQAGQLHRTGGGGGSGYDGHHHSPSPGIEHSPSPNLLGSQRRTTGASALVDQLKRLDLPAAELSSYGRRAPPSAVNRAAGQAPPRWQGGAQPSPYDAAGGFNRTLPPPHQSSASLASSGHGSSSSHLVTPAGVGSPSQPAPHVRSPYDDELSMPPPTTIDREPVRRLDVTAANAEVEAARKAALAPPKKKKWGLSSVFGSNNDSKADHSLVSVAEESSRSSVPLKRSQSISDRADSNTSLTSGEMHHHSDPKLAAKEAKKQAKALEMAKREAAEKASRERARAVMMKRERMVEATAEHYKSKASGQPSAGGKPVSSNYLIPSSSSSLGLQSPSTASLSSRTAPPPARSSAASQRLPPNMAALASHQRHKSRRRDGDDDHSTSSLDTNSFRSPSVATFHSVDSDPGPSRLARQYSSSVGVDPALGIRGSGYQTNSQGSNSSPQLYSLPQGSGSIENQLSRDFSTHARLANSPGGSYSSLVNPSYNPYGRGGSESSSLQLPSLASQGLPAPERSGYVNPMFHVVRLSLSLAFALALSIASSY
jgi:meiosis induction protein kinase IME2/SME1